MVPILWAFATLDQWLSDDRSVGRRRDYASRAQKRVAKRPKAKVVVFGQSTAEWLGQGHLARVLKRPKSEIVDGHIGASHSGTTFGQVTRMVAAGKHFEQAYFGVNLFALCQAKPAVDRVASHYEMTPARDRYRLLSIYSNSSRPLAYYGTFAGVAAWGAYGDGIGVRKRLWKLAGIKPIRNSKKLARRWVTKKKPEKRKPWLPKCAYDRKDTVKAAFVLATLEALGELADEVFYLVLPDRTLNTPASLDAWPVFLEHHRRSVEAIEGVHFVDLIEGGARKNKLFRDSVHLTHKGMRVASRRLRQALSEQGAL